MALVCQALGSQAVCGVFLAEGVVDPPLAHALTRAHSLPPGWTPVAPARGHVRAALSIVFAPLGMELTHELPMLVVAPKLCARQLHCIVSRFCKKRCHTGRFHG